MEVNKNAKPEKKLQRKLFSIEEDAKLRFLVSQYGNKDFKKIASFMPGRTPRQVRERYKNYLSPEVNNGPWSREEDALLCKKYMELGPKWSKIADFFPSRSDINVKNRWTSIKGTQPFINCNNNINNNINNNNKTNINCNNINAVPQQQIMPNYNHAMPIMPNPMMVSNLNNFPPPVFNTAFNANYNAFNSNLYNTAYANLYKNNNNNCSIKPTPQINPSTQFSDPIDDSSETKLPPDDYFCNTEEFERDDSNFLFSFDLNLNAEQHAFIFDNDFEL